MGGGIPVVRNAMGFGEGSVIRNAAGFVEVPPPDVGGMVGADGFFL